MGSADNTNTFKNTLDRLWQSQEITLWFSSTESWLEQEIEVKYVKFLSLESTGTVTTVMLGWLSDRAKGRGFKPRPWRCCATTLTQVVHTPLSHSRDTPRGGLNYLSNQNRMYQDSLIKAKACAHQINYGLRQGGQQCWALWGFSGSLPLCVTHQFLFGGKSCLLSLLAYVSGYANYSLILQSTPAATDSSLIWLCTFSRP